MLKIPTNVQKHLSNLIPASLINDIACFVFYDNHPKDEKNIDITICTKNGELKEFFQRDLISTISLDSVSQPTEIRIIRNNAFRLCYLVSADSDLYIISSNNKLDIVEKIINVDKYDIIDSACTGVGCLKIVKKDDAVPIYFDSKFESIDTSFIPTANNVETLPIISQLQKKLIEAKYTTKSNEGTLKEYQSIRQNVTLMSGQNLHPNMNDSVFKDDSINIAGGLKMKNLPHVTVCNQKLVMILEVINEYDEPIQDVHILLETNIPSMVYTTKLFSKIPSSPYWQENDDKSLKPNQDSAVVAVIELHQIQYRVTSRIDVAGAISYKNSVKEYILPFEDVNISSLQSMGDEFDAFSSNADHHTILSILATTQKTELTLRHIKNLDEPDIPLQELLCTHIKMENVCPNVIVYRKSPYHSLNGVMIVFMENHGNGKHHVTVYTRFPSQVLTLLHCISDAIPTKIIATTHNYRVTAKNDDFSQYNDDTQTENVVNHTAYAKSILMRTTKILEYMDSCMVKMGSSKDPTVQSKIGSNIDLFANGVENFREFKNVLLEESRRGIESLFMKQETTDSDVMIVE